MLFGRWHPFFSLMFSLPYIQWHETKCMVMLHIKNTILIFQCCPVLHPFPHINLSWAFFLTVVLICAQTMINMPLVPCDKILPISFHACLQLLPPYYFRKVAVVTKLRWFHSLLYISCSTYPFLVQMCFCLQEWNMEMCFSLCVGEVSWYRVTISSTSHEGSLCGIPWRPSVCSNSPLWLRCVSWQMEELDQTVHILYGNEWKQHFINFSRLLTYFLFR